MEKNEFLKLFESHLDLARETLENLLQVELPQNYKIALRGLGYSGREKISVSEAVDKLYLEEELFFVFIDIMVYEADRDHTVFFVRPSGHRPRPFDQTWNTPAGNGPFKQLGYDIDFIRKRIKL